MKREYGTTSWYVEGNDNGTYSLLLNLLAMTGRTSTAPTRVSKKGSNESNAQSDGSNSLSVLM